MLEFFKQYVELFWDYLKPYFLVNHYQEAVLLTNGKYAGTFRPGLYLKFPLFEYALEANIKPDTLTIAPIPITTLDGETISIGLMIDYHIEPMAKNQPRLTVTNTQKFILENNDSLTNFKDRAAGELSDMIEDMKWEEIRQKPTKTKLKNKIKDYAKDLGITVDDLKFTHKAKAVVYSVQGSAGVVPITS